VPEPGSTPAQRGGDARDGGGSHRPADPSGGEGARRLTRPDLAVGLRTSISWLLAPATDDVPRHQAVGATALRLLLGLLWLWNAGWKVPPDFGTNGKKGLYQFTSYAVSDPVFPPYSWLVEHLILPNLPVFGWGVLLAESTVAVLLLTGAWVRLAALLGVGQSLVIGMSVAYGPAEWPWSYLLMIGAHLTLLFSSAGRRFAVDAVRAGRSTGRSLTLAAGLIAVLFGLVACLTSLDDPLVPRGMLVGIPRLQVGLGHANLVGGAVLLLIGSALLTAEKVGPLGLRAAATVAAIAALSLHAQIGFTDPFLGGSATSAAFFLSLAVVAAVRARALTTPGGPS
jgi:uncharacterized membrane protein YphA (DoxX/SURF4 family)